MRGREGDAAAHAPVVEQRRRAREHEHGAHVEAEAAERDAGRDLQRGRAEDGDANERAREPAEDLEEHERRRAADDDGDGNRANKEVAIQVELRRRRVGRARRERVLRDGGHAVLEGDEGDGREVREEGDAEAAVAEEDRAVDGERRGLGGREGEHGRGRARREGLGGHFRPEIRIESK